MAGILTRDTINQPVLSYKCVSEVLQYEYQEFLGDEYRRLWVQGWNFHEALTRQQMGKICRFEASAKCSIIDSMELEE